MPRDEIRREETTWEEIRREETTWEEIRRRRRLGRRFVDGTTVTKEMHRREETTWEEIHREEMTWEEIRRRRRLGRRFVDGTTVTKEMRPVPGVEGEPVSLPEPATEAIAAAFGQWLLHKKNVGSRKLRVSVGHDSRISAPTLLCTLTEDESFLCPADGAIMITPSHLPYNRNGFKFLLIFKHFFSERSAAVDSSGREFNRNRLIALLSAIFLEQAQSEDDAVKLGLVVANAVKEFNALDTSALSSLTRS
ncbi:hypothetical protein YC2023_062096 [Brassica napus]